VAEAAAAVRMKAAGEARLAAFVVYRDDHLLPSEHGLRDFLRRRLPGYMIPESIQTLPQLPRTPSGKLDRRALAALAPETASTQRIRTLPKTPLERFLAGLWRELLNLEEIGARDNFYELGGTSLQGAMFVSRLQRELSLRLPLVTVFELPTVVDLAQFLAQAFPDAIAERFGRESTTAYGGDSPLTSHASVAEAEHGTSRPGEAGDGTNRGAYVLHSAGPELLVPLRASGTRTPLFLIHPPGGIVVCYQPLTAALPAEQPVYGLRARGLHPGESLPTSVEQMAAEYRAVIEACQPHGPYLLGGWSLGGVMAMEVAQQLLASGEQMALLAFFDTTIPHGQANRQFLDDADGSGLEYGFDITLDELAAMPDEQQLPFLWRHVERLGLLDTAAPEDVVQQLLEDLKKVFRVHVQICSEYTVRPYPGTVTLFRPEESPVAVATRRDRGWGAVAREVEVHWVPGHHHTMVKQPHVQRLAELLADCLLRAQTIGHS
jgi:thioesterase domain-containing protein/acyl carrier protein